MLLKLINNIYFNIAGLPGKVQLEVTNKCNLNCGMCPRAALGVEYKDMEPAVVEKVLTNLRRPTKIILTGWGEPLLHPRIFDIIRLCKSRGHKVEMTTNGVLLTQATARKLTDSGVDSVTVSVDCLGRAVSEEFRHACPSIEENIVNLVTARQGRKKPQIILQPTLHKGKEEDVFDIIKRGNELGVDMINIARLDRRYDTGGKIAHFTSDEEKQVAKKITELSDKSGIRVDMIPFTAFTGVKRFLYRLVFKIWQRIGKFCPKLYNYLYVTHDGKVTPCCALPKYVLGDMQASALNDIWHSRQFKEFRKKQDIVCRGCEVLRSQ